MTILGWQLNILRYGKICVLVAVAILEEVAWYLQICNSLSVERISAHGPLVGKELSTLHAICSFCGCLIVFVFPFAVWDLMWIGLYQFLSSLIYFKVKIEVSSRGIVIPRVSHEWQMFTFFLHYLSSDSRQNIANHNKQLKILFYLHLAVCRVWLFMTVKWKKNLDFWTTGSL